MKYKLLTIDITMSCDLKCYKCNRFCDIASDQRDDFTLDQINWFIEETCVCNYDWRRIRISGGEPTRCAIVDQVISKLLDYKQKYNKALIIELFTNGFSSISKNKINKYKNKIKILNSNKKTKNTHKLISSIAPIDIYEYDKKIYQQRECFDGCHLVKEVLGCSLCLNRYGFYPSSPCGAVDRIFGFDIGIKELKNLNDNNIEFIFNKLCRYCGMYYQIESNYPSSILSKTWDNAIQKYHKEKPHLGIYSKCKNNNATSPGKISLPLVAP